jgi:hypothetical protein
LLFFFPAALARGEEWNTLVAAKPVPPSAMNSATSAVPIAGVGRKRRDLRAMRSPF